jgi:hypothetical protein
MEFKCPICSKPYPTRKECLACMIECDNAATAREDLERRKKSTAEADQKRKEKETRIAELKKQAQYHLNEFFKCNAELYEDPECCNNRAVLKFNLPPEWGDVYEIVRAIGLL